MFNLFKDESQSVNSFFLFMQSLANRNLVAEALKVSEAKYRSLLENMGLGVIYLSNVGTVISANQVAGQIMGMPLDNMMGRALTDTCSRIVKEDGSVLAHDQHPAMLALRTGKPVENVVMGLFNHAQQNHTWVMSSSVPEFLPGEREPHQVFMTLTDITRRKRAEEESSLASVIVNNTGEGIVVTDQDNKIISVNPAFTILTGFSRQEVLGKRAHCFQSPKDAIKIDEALRNSRKNGNSWQGELWHRRKNSDDFPCWTTINQVKDATGRTTHHVYVVMDITHLKKDQNRLGFLAYHDPLTKLPNRMLLKDRINHALQNARREGSQVAVLFLDLDRFKIINDTYGHAVGDGLLKEVATRIKNLVRKEDTVSRYAGDEFIVFMEDVSDTKSPATLARKLIETFNIPVEVKGHTLQVTTSVGISLFPRDGDDSDSLIKNADAAMYRAKKEGRNNFQYYRPELTTQAFEKMAVETELRQSIDKRELVLYYQPRVCLKTGNIAGIETLVHWQHPVMGLIPPARFIPVAQESGFILALGEWMVEAACRQMRCWLDERVPVNKIVVNVSAFQLLRSDFLATVERILREHELSPRCLELEINECSLMDNAEHIIKALNGLADAGMDLTIADFGKGYFSLINLKRIPVKKLKIDRSFVSEMLCNSNYEAVIRSVIALGNSLNLQVIAQGIESEAQKDKLIEMGCNLGQGDFYFPLALPDAKNLTKLMS
ncbi:MULTISPECIES: sensor domain-containing protein [Methylobacter]|uniref:sensor domain-containing protein n=1 Tax=Methylobacter TaxID=429 RepID=UPI00036BE297|nr:MULTISPECIES: bifunctional diguanylate cyclase/phosphodiesterase [Methylobacter]